ncbi:cytochrome [Cyanobacterium sp. uoEpiScrs1]|uniref:cytochrome n=1 Tax=Cyanobacterium sp. uoEpiScrs1 TaxID=2976343 RepID=UPI00226A1EA5|nr:cytochrome [Cyanobacterium sp. uoEpiScrs1]
MFKTSWLSIFSRFNLVSVVIVLAISFWSISIGWGMTYVLNKFTGNVSAAIAAPPNNDVSTRNHVGQEFYIKTCAACHIALPPEVLPRETWKKLLENPNKHYGTSVPNLIRLGQLLIWDYLQTCSRSLSSKDEPIPFYVEQSRYFKIIHPRVKFQETVSNKNCIICHPGVENFDFRTLTPEWKNSP